MDLDTQLQTIRQDVVSKALDSPDPETEAKKLLQEAGVDAKGIEVLDGSDLPTSMCFLFGHMHAAQPHKSFEQIVDELKKELAGGKQPADVLREAGLDPKYQEEIDQNIENDMVAFLVGYRFSKEAVPA